MASPPPSPDLPLREACLHEARAVLAEDGPEGLSLRKVARRLGVSHQAPYKHFANKEAILAELVRRAFDAFARHLGALPVTDDPFADLRRIGRAYLGYARDRPLEYRLMFGAPLPDPAAHPELARHATGAFEVLRAAVARAHGPKAAPRAVRLDALFIWSTVHGLAGVLEARTSADLDLVDADDAALIDHVLDRIGAGLRPR